MFKLKEIREYEDYSLAEIAQKIHVSKSSYADWESARAVIPLKHMVSLANVYHISLDYLFGLSDDMSKILEKRVLNPNIIEVVVKNIKRIRKEKGITQEQLALDVGISYDYYRHFEADLGKEGISVINLYKISVVLGVDIGTFFVSK